MIITEKNITLENGKTLKLRSPKVEEAKLVLEHMIITSGETYFMIRYPEEFIVDDSFMQQRIKAVNENPDDFMISAFIDGEFVGNCSLQRIRYNMKYMHRAGFGISIQKKACNMGVGHYMIEETIRNAKKTTFEQIELGTFSDNERAKHLYQKMGFVETGIQPRAFKLKDGTYRDEIQMIYYLK